MLGSYTRVTRTSFGGTFRRRLRLLALPLPLMVFAACGNGSNTATGGGGSNGDSCGLPDIQISMTPTVAELGEDVTIDVQGFDSDLCEATVTGVDGLDQIQASQVVTADVGIGVTSVCECPDGSTDITSRTLPVRAARLTWEAPASNIDGSTLDLTGYNLYHGPESGSLASVQAVDASETEFTVGDLPPGTRYFRVTAVNAAGESNFSNEVSKDIP